MVLLSLQLALFFMKYIVLRFFVIITENGLM